MTNAKMPQLPIAKQQDQLWPDLFYCSFANSFMLGGKTGLTSGEVDRGGGVGVDQVQQLCGQVRRHLRSEG